MPGKGCSRLAALAGKGLCFAISGPMSVCMSYSAYETLIAPARDKPESWRLAVGVVLGVGLYAGLGIGYFQLGKFLFGANWVIDAARAAPGTPLQILFLLGTFSTMVIGVLAAAALHGRTLRDLIGGYARTMRMFLRSMIGMAPVMIAVFVYSFATTDLTPNISPTLWVALLPAAFGLLFIQVSAEELVFRGYLQSQLAAMNIHPVFWIGIPSIIFGLVHYDPATMGELAPYIVIWAIFFGVVAADLTARTGTLGPAIALHFANNMFPLLFFGYPDYLGGLSLYSLPYSISDQESAVALLVTDGVVLLILYTAIRFGIKGVSCNPEQG